MSTSPLWIIGPTRSGKTTRLVEQFVTWISLAPPNPLTRGGVIEPSFPLDQGETTANLLVFAANGDTRIQLADQLIAAIDGRYAVDSTTPFGFMQREVMLFWPLLVQELGLKAQFPLRLRPENEQELATQLWQPEFEQRQFDFPHLSQAAMVRRILDVFQLAALGGVPREEIPHRLSRIDSDEFSQIASEVGALLSQWRDWCLHHGFLTYGLIAELYWRYLLPQTTYQQHLFQRYRGVLADDVDEYPAIARHWFECFLAQGHLGAFTYNPDGKLRAGLGADPEALAKLSDRCQIELLSDHPKTCISDVWHIATRPWLEEPASLLPMPNAVHVIQTISRAQLLRQTAEVIVDAVQNHQAEPKDIAVLSPGLDAIVQYSLINILSQKGIAVQVLNTQHPLINTPVVRALLTLLALVYPNLGRLLDREAVADMLVCLSASPDDRMTDNDASLNQTYKIDPVRAGLLADHCFVPHPHHPQLLPLKNFPRWDRIGHQATTAYNQVLEWVETYKQHHNEQDSDKGLLSLDTLLNQAIHYFLGSRLPYRELSALRELMETCHHYCGITSRLNQDVPGNGEQLITMVQQFIQLVRMGTITADPYPIWQSPQNTVTLSTVFQYRSVHANHRWHFWLDVGSSRWLTGEKSLFGASVFQSPGTPVNPEEQIQHDENRLHCHVLDLCGRATEWIYLCHSELDTNGQEQTGPLSTWVYTKPNHY